MWLAVLAGEGGVWVRLRMGDGVVIGVGWAMEVDGIGDDGNEWEGAKRRAFSYCCISNKYVYSCHSYVLSVACYC